MLGGGNPVGSSNPSGTGSSLSYVGDHAYANSGFFTAAQTGSGLDVLKFSTGNSYIVGTLTFNGYAAVSEPEFGTEGVCEMKFNDEIVAVLKNSTGLEEMPTNTVVDILIPPYTKVNLRINANGSNATVGATVMIQGRVYR